MTEHLSTVQACAKNKYINQYLSIPGSKLKVPERIEETYLGNTGYLVHFTFKDDHYPGAIILLSVSVSWEEIDAWNKKQSNRLAP